VILDCCHSGTTLELPGIYKADDDGNINLMDNVEAGMSLMGEAQGLIQGGFTFEKLGAARHLLAGASDFFRGLRHEFEGGDDEGVQQAGDYGQLWVREGNSAFKDERTSVGELVAGN
jgi:metacaspase-1